MEHVLLEPEKEAAEPSRNAQQSPSVIVNISDEGDATECFLLVYKTDTSEIFDKLAVVTANAVYKGGKSCVEKPATKKRLDDNDHLSKVLATILSASSMAAGESSPHGGIHAAAVLPVNFTNREAVVTVKEALRGGSSFVELATVRLPAIKERNASFHLRRATYTCHVAKASGGLLLGVLRETYRRGHEVEKSRRELERARLEQARLTELINSAIREKREVVQKLLERAALVINAKKAMIANLQDQGSDDEESGGEGWGDADSDGTIAAAKGYGAGQPNPTPEPEGQLKQAASPTRVGKMPRNSDRVGSVPGAAERESMKGRGGKVTLEYGNDSVAGMGEGCVALAVPLGTQEVSGGDLLRHVAGKRVRDGDNFVEFGVGGGEEDDLDGGISRVIQSKSVKRLRPTETPSVSRENQPRGDRVGETDDNCGNASGGGIDGSSSENEALKLVRDDGSDNDGIGDTEGRGKVPRRRRKAQKSKPAVKEERVEANDPKKPEGGVDMSKFTSGLYDDFWEEDLE